MVGLTQQLKQEECILSRFKWLAFGLAIVTIVAFSMWLNGEIQSLNKKINISKSVGMELEQQRIDKANKTQIQQDELQKKLQQQIDDLKLRVQAKQQNAVLASITPVAQASGEDAKMFIYMHESGNNPGSVNKSSGACGLGQALPCSKMPCSLSDYACQDNFFTSYMKARYGTWENARAFWLQHSWW